MLRHHLHRGSKLPHPSLSSATIWFACPGASRCFCFPAAPSMDPACVCSWSEHRERKLCSCSSSCLREGTGHMEPLVDHFWPMAVFFILHLQVVIAPSPFQTLSLSLWRAEGAPGVSCVTAKFCLGSPHSSSESQVSASVHEDEAISGFDSLPSL